MPAVRDVLARKGSAGAVHSVPPGALVLEAARLMNERGIGSVLVMDGDHLVGIFTERDVLRRVVASGRDPLTTAVREVMTTELLTCSSDTPLEECAATMSGRRIRHLPVLDDDRVTGVMTSGDLLAWQLDDQASMIRHLNSYVYDVR